MTAAFIITRPQPMAEATWKRARAAGLDAHICSLFEAEAMAWEVPDIRCYDALFISSAQSMRLGGPNLDRLKNLPAYAVGPATAEAAAAQGFQILKSGETDGQTLIGEMEDQNIRSILWLCGESHTPLAPARAALQPLPCYRMKEITLPAQWDELLAKPAVISAYSSRGAQRIAQLIPNGREQHFIAAISEKVAAAVGEGWGEIAIAKRPIDTAMLAVATILCHKAA